MDQEKEMPASKIDLKILGNMYSLDFPNVGQLISIERLKIKMSDSTYNQLLFGSTRQSQLAFTAIEAIATFTVLIPKLKEDLTLKSLLDLPLPRVKELTDVYEKEFYPWYKDWFNIINEESSVKEEELSDTEENKPDNYEIVP